MKLKTIVEAIGLAKNDDAASKYAAISLLRGHLDEPSAAETMRTLSKDSNVEVAAAALRLLPSLAEKPEIGKLGDKKLSVAIFRIFQSHLLLCKF